MTEQWRVRLQWIVGAALIAVVLATVWMHVPGIALGFGIETRTAPQGLTNLQFARTEADAKAIVAEWKDDQHKTDALEPARQVLASRKWVVAGYVAAGLLALWLSWLVSPMALLPLRFAGVLIVGAGASGLASAILLTQLLADGASADAFDHTFRMARLASMTYSALALLSTASVLAIATGAVRAIRSQRKPPPAKDLREDASSPPPPQVKATDKFEAMMRLENAGIFPDTITRAPDEPYPAYNASADEPYVAFRAADTIGLALSGGGIRSATFNLGLLQGLHRLDLLRLFDYLSTVSGGGYVGAFWTEWLARREAELKRTPSSDSPTDKRRLELFPGTRNDRRLDSAEERHLREFSGFLAPRVGFFEIETWTAIVAVTAGLIPALAIGLSVLSAGVVAWLSLTFAIASPNAFATATVLAVVTFFTLYFFERAWRDYKHQQSSNSDVAPSGVGHYLPIAAVAVLLATGLQAAAPWLFAQLSTEAAQWPVYGYVSGKWHLIPSAVGLGRWWQVTGIQPPAMRTIPWIVSPRLFDFGLVWLATSLILSLFRPAFYFSQTPNRNRIAAFDRVLMRLMALGVAWLGITMVWHLAINLPRAVALAGAAFSAGSFALLRNWIGTAFKRGEDTSLTGRLKPYLPQILAYVAIVLSAVVVAGLLIVVCRDDWSRWWYAAAAMTAWLVVALFIEPTAFGLHVFYRERLSRAYIGACNVVDAALGARANRHTQPQTADDRGLGDACLPGRPLHLVCCAANDLQGDALGTLARGARSATLSKHGFTVGPHFSQWQAATPTLGAAITASAAAFNSNMGNVSMDVGPAVSFLMTMLNLRLGLWVRHPSADPAAPRRWPGLLFYREMFGLTSASGSLPDGREVTRMHRDVHLSDGGHFENLALYELVRRHCRYIVVSDCAADPTGAFSDLGNAIRRIREDFGVDIELDVAPLRRDKDGRAKQYVAVGTIHYSDSDRGILIYIKPTVLGTEPTDVLQYQQRNPVFPQESTGDQFYDEAQWESYRRLGQHAAEEVFCFVADEGRANLPADWVFAEAAHRWGPIPPGLEDKVLEMTKRFGSLESELQQRQTLSIFAELFPEMDAAPAPAVKGDGGTQPAPTLPDTADTIAADLAFLLRATQLMEDVWTACELDVWWKHPLNIGWINLFARWTTAPTFVYWWPVLAPMYTPGFRRFIQQRFPLPDWNPKEDESPADDPPKKDDPSAGGSPKKNKPSTWNPAKGRVEEYGPELPKDGLAISWWRDRATQPIRTRTTVPGATRAVFANVLTLEDHRSAGRPPIRLQVGLVVVTFADTQAGWTSDDFFVPPSLWGAGIGWYFLKGVLQELHQRKVKRCVVTVPPLGFTRHLSARQDRLMFIEQYRKIGFREHRVVEGHPLKEDDIAMCGALECDAATATVLVLEDLKTWAERRPA